MTKASARAIPLLRPIAALYVLAILLTVALADMGAIGVLIDRVRTIPHGDHLAHGLLAAPLALAACALARFRWLGRAQLGTAVLIVLVALEELTQLWVPNRTFDLMDLASDLLGIALGDLAARWLAARTLGTSVARS